MRYQLLNICVLFPIIVFSQSLKRSIVYSTNLNQPVEVFTLSYSAETPSLIYYFTDGKKMIDYKTAHHIDSLVKLGLIPSATYVFVSSIHPETGKDLREQHFFCNDSYLAFFQQELIPHIEQTISKQPQRHLIGVSFGALNAAFFAAKSSYFRGFALLSPITYPCPDLNQQLTFSKQRNYKLYLSTGKLDAENYVEALLPMFKFNTKTIKVVQTEGGHDFENWNRQLETLINYLAN